MTDVALKHIRVLERRRDWLKTRENEGDTANTYIRSERAALDAVLGALNGRRASWAVVPHEG